MNRKTHSLITKIAQPKLEEISLGLQQHFGSSLKAFCHDISFPGGELSMLTNNPGMIELFCDKKIMPNFHDANGRVVPPGIYSTTRLIEQYGEYALNVNLVLDSLEIKQGVHILQATPDCQHMYYFGFDMKPGELDDVLINKLGFLQDFLVQYRYKASSIIHQAHKKSERIFYPKLLELTPKVGENKADGDYFFDRKTGLILNVSLQQKNCLSLLLNGISSKEIAQKMNLSHRTVEHYLAEIRRKNGYASIKQLLSYVKPSRYSMLKF